MQAAFSIVNYFFGVDKNDFERHQFMAMSYRNCSQQFDAMSCGYVNVSMIGCTFQQATLVPFEIDSNPKIEYT